MTNKVRNCILIFIGILILVLGLNILQDPGQKYAKKGDYYFKKNNLILAQKYYEKAFDAGFNTPESRISYINAIINSPINTDAQERLVKFLDNTTEDNAKVQAKYFLENLKQEIRNKYPSNYIEQAPYHQKILRWTTSPIKYGFTSQNNLVIPEYFKSEIDSAFLEWEKATNHQILFEITDKNPNILINFIENNPAKDDEHKFVVAYTTPTINENILKQMSISFYLRDPQKNYFSKNQVYNTAVHEIAHALGFMGHSYNKEDVMYLAKDSIAVYNDKRDELTTSDINTIKLLYKIKPDISDTISPTGLYIPYLIIGNNQDILDAKSKEAKNYIRKAPKIASGYIDLANYLANNHEYTKAIYSLEKALELSNTDELRGMVYFNLAVVYAEINNTPMAKNYLAKSQQIKDSTDIHYFFADLYTREKDFNKAISEYKYLLTSDSKNIEYIIGLTNIYIKQKQYLKARKVLKTYFRLCPEQKNNPRLDPYGIIKAFL
ncbi:MAG: matrixin family metalloprotease [bacterium]|nr:matrixin family metalloprotease [bacterium]